MLGNNIKVWKKRKPPIIDRLVLNSTRRIAFQAQLPALTTLSIEYPRLCVQQVTLPAFSPTTGPEHQSVALIAAFPGNLKTSESLWSPTAVSMQILFPLDSQHFSCSTERERLPLTLTLLFAGMQEQCFWLERLNLQHVSWISQKS